MCGIAGVLGRPGAAAVVHTALQALEYRGYDSCGIAWLGSGLEMERAVGAVENLHIRSGDEAAAIGHTRWATHGNVTLANAHPHADCGGDVAVVHNGVLLNHAELRKTLQAAGHELRSDTDSEALAHLWEDDAGGSGLDRLRRLRQRLQGTYSIAVLDADEEAVYVAKHRNPLWVAVTDGVTYLASDPVALRRHADEAVPLEDGDHGRLTAGEAELWDGSGRRVERAAVAIKHLEDSIHKAGYEHHMLKEIHEIPGAINRLLAQHVRQVPPYVDLGVKEAFLDGFDRVTALGAGTSYHAAWLTAMQLHRVAGVPAEARATPEYKDDPTVPERSTLVLAMSQSGETLDTLQALHRLASHSHSTLAFTNHPTSSIGRHADHVVALRSGQEVSVAATKTFLSQAVLGYLLAVAKGRRTAVLSDGQAAQAAQALVALPRALERTLLRRDAFQAMARSLAGHENVFLLAKGLLVPVAHEGALKLKEIAYQHAEAYPAGELKHGPFALLTAETAVVFLLAPGDQEDSVLNSLQEVRARGAPTFVVAMDGCRDPEGDVLWVPATEAALQPLVFAAALHLLSYWTAKARGLPIDRPRNLAKSVTVE